MEGGHGELSTQGSTGEGIGIVDGGIAAHLSGSVCANGLSPEDIRGGVVICILRTLHQHDQVSAQIEIGLSEAEGDHVLTVGDGHGAIEDQGQFAGIDVSGGEIGKLSATQPDLDGKVRGNICGCDVGIEAQSVDHSLHHIGQDFILVVDTLEDAGFVIEIDGHPGCLGTIAYHEGEDSLRIDANVVVGALVVQGILISIQEDLGVDIAGAGIAGSPVQAHIHGLTGIDGGACNGALFHAGSVEELHLISGLRIGAPVVHAHRVGSDHSGGGGAVSGDAHHGKIVLRDEFHHHTIDIEGTAGAAQAMLEAHYLTCSLIAVEGYHIFGPGGGERYRLYLCVGHGILGIDHHTHGKHVVCTGRAGIELHPGEVGLNLCAIGWSLQEEHCCCISAVGHSGGIGCAVRCGGVGLHDGCGCRGLDKGMPIRRQIGSDHCIKVLLIGQRSESGAHAGGCDLHCVSLPGHIVYQSDSGGMSAGNGGSVAQREAQALREVYGSGQSGQILQAEAGISGYRDGRDRQSSTTGIDDGKDLVVV